MVPHRTTNRCASDGVMAGNVTCHSTYRGTFDASLSICHSGTQCY